MKIRDVKLGILDTNVIRDMAERPKVATVRLNAIHLGGMLTAITQRILTEIHATKNPTKRQKQLDVVMSQVDVFLPTEAHALVKIEIAEQYPAAVIGDQTLLSARVIETLTYPASALERFSAKNREREEQVKKLAPATDQKLETLGGLSSFSDVVQSLAVEKVKEFLKAIKVKADMRPEALRALFDRGRATRMAVLVGIAYSYHRAKRRLEKRTPKPGGALSDAPILGAAAYSHLVFTADEGLIEYGELLKEVIATPAIGRWRIPPH